MDKLLLALVPEGDGWYWSIYDSKEDRLVSYWAQKGKEHLQSRIPFGQYGIYTNWAESGIDNDFDGLNFENVKREIARVFKPIDLCMFTVRNKETLQRLLSQYAHLRGFEQIELGWGNPWNIETVLGNYWFYKIPDWKPFPLGRSAAEACQKLRERIIAQISLDPSFAMQRIVNEETAALNQRKLNALDMLPFSAQLDPSEE